MHISSEPIGSSWRGHERFADWLVRELKPDVIVELGVDLGFSSFVFARPGIGTVYGIDSFEGDPEAGFKNAYDSVVARQRELKITNLELIKGYFSDVAKEWDMQIDILHIDGRHRYEDVKQDFELWSVFVRAGGVILLHDTSVTRQPFGVKRFFSEISLPKTAFTHSNGLGIVSTDAELIKRIKREFRIGLVSKRWWRMLTKIRREIIQLFFGPKSTEF